MENLMTQFFTYAKEYGIAIVLLIFLVYFLGKYVLRQDQRKDMRIDTLESDVKRLNDAIVKIKEEQASKFLEITMKMVDVIERNTQALSESKKVQETLQKYVGHFLEKNGYIKN